MVNITHLRINIITKRFYVVLKTLKSIYGVLLTECKLQTQDKHPLVAFSVDDENYLIFQLIVNTKLTE